MPVEAGGASHAVNGAQAAVVRDGRVLLQLRLWPPGWELPGGHLEAGEDPAACAAREVEEETGIAVRVVGLVGVYRWSGLRRTADAVYLAEPTGGRWHRTIESLAVRWVRPDRPPRTVFPWIRTRITDALAVAAGGDPVVRVQQVTIRHVLMFGSSWVAVPVDAMRRRRRARRARP